MMQGSNLTLVLLNSLCTTLLPNFSYSVNRVPGPTSSGNTGKSRKNVPCMEQSWNLKKPEKIMEFCEII